MAAQLFLKECKQTARSLVYWLIILALLFNFTTQLGDMEIDKKPEPGQKSYGKMKSRDSELNMKSTLGKLTEEYWRESYTTYPIGFYKHVTLNESDDKKIGGILNEAAGIGSHEAAEKAVEAWYAAQKESKGLGSEDDPVYMEPLQVEPAEGLSAGRYAELMDEADKILGGGSNYTKENRENGVEIPMTYEDALAQYDMLIEKDRLTGGYARLFADYMVIFLGILPVFLSVTRGLRDRRSMMQELIYTRRCSSFTIMASRYLAMVAMLTIPALILSLVPLSKCMVYARTAGIAVDMLAFVKYVFGWLVPTIMAVTGVGMFFTELTDTAAAVLVQGVWWFTAVFCGMDSLRGGSYGWNLVPRHNTNMNWQGFNDGFSQLLANRIVYAAAGLVLMALTAFIYTQKRKGRLQIRGKIFANRKGKSEV